MITILVAPLVSCSARLQVYILIAGTFFRPFAAALAILAMHFLGFALAMLVGRLLRSTLFKGANAPFVMELPPYRMPVLKSTIIHMWEKGSLFLSRAGTTILAGATLVWFLSHYPGITNQQWSDDFRQQERAVLAQQLPKPEEANKLEALLLAKESRIVNSSLAAKAGRWIQPILRPILDPDRNRKEAWKDVVALTAGFVAKEIVVSTMAVVHQAKAGDPEPGSGWNPLQRSLRADSGMTPLIALAFMVFILVYTPCLGTVSMMRKELGSWGWSIFGVGYGLGLAWLLAWVTVLAGRAMGFA
jgi:ferrous iron transport protein B